MNPFEEIRIVDNFYQTSSFYPMPIILVGTIDQNTGLTNLGSYSLCFPYYIAGKGSYTMLLECRNNSNTAINILKTKKCSLNFITDSRKYLKECLRLGFPGENTKEKMENCVAWAKENSCTLITENEMQIINDKRSKEKNGS